ncbi:MAG: bifunctional phosphopantothenoylcysteine decarboxylase/phosphopantothenate--cysteine ligase CoaBC [Mariprofundaceae bacterium]|nr:bifunctional phosphopantothenoylcysteine decarboxylase/phosphopantothenate--cysteine ligase CoaBC [Mariprofundaceae bacterium]
MFQHKKILLAIGGGIAVYRIAELARLLIKQGAHIRCVMTESACAFVTPLTFEALTGEKVHRHLFDLTLEREMGHIQLVRWADVVVIAPATANLIAKLTHGIADDLLSTMMQACDVPVLLAPAMNTSMWESAATQRNIQQLKTSGFAILAPNDGFLACGEHGSGRLPEPQNIADAILPLLMPQNLSDEHWVINAGPTEEPWDAVRLLTNRASGTLGARLAQIAAAMGARVSLIAGPRTPEFGHGIQRDNVQTAEEMLLVCEHRGRACDVFVATAAVSDFRFVDISQEKMKRGDTTQLAVSLTSNIDIVAHIAAMQERPKKVVAFAVESSNHLAFAKDKMLQKGVDAIVANDVQNMGNNHAGGWWLDHHSQSTLENSSKYEFAQQIVHKIMEIPS